MTRGTFARLERQATGRKDWQAPLDDHGGEYTGHGSGVDGVHGESTAAHEPVGAGSGSTSSAVAEAERLRQEQLKVKRDYLQWRAERDGDVVVGAHGARMGRSAPEPSSGSEQNGRTRGKQLRAHGRGGDHVAGSSSANVTLRQQKAALEHSVRQQMQPQPPPSPPAAARWHPQTSSRGSQRSRTPGSSYDELKLEVERMQNLLQRKPAGFVESPRRG